MSTVDENIEVTVTSIKTKKVPGKLGTILTENEFNTISKMITSRDVGDHRMAQAILNQCDIEKSIYWIWKLSKIAAYNMVYLRTKASREFSNESKLYTIVHKRATEFALYLIEKKWLTTDIYQMLKAELFQEMVHRNRSNNFYEVHLVIKDRYREFDPESTLTHLSMSSDESI